MIRNLLYCAKASFCELGRIYRIEPIRIPKLTYSQHNKMKNSMRIANLFDYV